MNKLAYLNIFSMAGGRARDKDDEKDDDEDDEDGD